MPRRHAPLRLASARFDALPGEPLLRLEAPSARDKGFAPWTPTPGTIEHDLYYDLREQIDAYAEYLPVGPRTLMYRILPYWLADPERLTEVRARQRAFGKARAYDGQRAWYPNKDALDGQVTAVLTKARRAGLIQFDWIDDRRTASDEPSTADGLENIVSHMQVNRQRGQPYRVEVWVETQANVTRLANVCNAYGISVYSGSGSVPIKANHATAQRILFADQPTLLIVLGDCDPAGLKNIASALADDVRAFVHDLGRRIHTNAASSSLDERVLNFARAVVDVNHIAEADADNTWAWVDERLYVKHIGITPTLAAAQPEAVREYFANPPADWPLRRENPDGTVDGYKVELEALPPDQLEALLRSALDAVRDEDAYRSALADEKDAIARELHRLAYKLEDEAYDAATPAPDEEEEDGDDD